MDTAEGSGSWDMPARHLHSHFPPAGSSRPAVQETLPSCPGLSPRSQPGPEQVPLPQVSS